VALSYPDLYEIGMSNSAVKILYAGLNAVAGVACERVFAPAPDFEAALRAAGLPLCSLETGRAVFEFDIVAFSFGYELTLTNLLAILEAGGVSLEGRHRRANEPIVLVGGPAATNPAPLGMFADAVFIGEAEGWLEGAFARMARMKTAGARREDLLGFLRDDPSIWHPGKTGIVRRAYWRGFSDSAARTVFPVPSLRVVQDHGTVEIMRGCPNACRFCHATVLYRPSRLKNASVIREEVRALVEEAGYRQITLSSLSSGDFRYLHELVRELNIEYSGRKVSFSLPSLRVDSLSLALLREISEVRKSGLTFAVETARPEWQKQVRKTVTREKIVGLLREARSQGWKAAKFYFMVGLPPSFDEDEATPIIDFLRAVRDATRMSLNVNVAAFIPKPHTPWERESQLDEKRALARILAVKQGLSGDGFKIGYHAPILSLLEGIVSRGGERAGALVLDAYRRGARLDAWEEHIRLEVWRQAIAEAGWDPLGDACRPRLDDEALPWDTISLGLSASVAAEGPAGSSHTDASRTAESGAKPATRVTVPSSLPGKRILFSYAKHGAAVYVSHLDLMTVFERSVARAGYAARFTEGFNPKPRLEFANPLSLGLHSEEEIAGIDLHDFDTASSFIERLNRSLPPGITITRAGVVPPVPTGAPRRSLMSLYWGSDFEITDPGGGVRPMRVPASGASIRKTLEAEGAWQTSTARRMATWAADSKGAPASYFDALAASASGGAAPPS
jgi:radical SAM-linked protein